jgi:hypothetical protein
MAQGKEVEDSALHPSIKPSPRLDRSSFQQPQLQAHPLPPANRIMAHPSQLVSFTLDNGRTRWRTRRPVVGKRARLALGRQPSSEEGG